MINDPYEQYQRLFLSWNDDLKVVSSCSVPYRGLYLITFQAQVVNDSKRYDDYKLILVTAKLFVNDIKIKGWTENIDSERHYACPTLVVPISLKKNDVISIKMRADAMTAYPLDSVFVITNPDRFQFDLTLLRKEKKT